MTVQAPPRMLGVNEEHPETVLPDAIYVHDTDNPIVLEMAEIMRNQARRELWRGRIIKVGISAAAGVGLAAGVTGLMLNKERI